MATDVQTSAYYVQLALRLAVFTVAYNVVEGVVAVGFGAGDESISLIGFGSDSFIEVFSAMMVLWRFRKEVKQKWRKNPDQLTSGVLPDSEDTGSQQSGPSAEDIALERACTRGIGYLLVLLALGAWIGAILQLVDGSHPSTTTAGLFVSSLSLSFMFFLWYYKTKAAIALDSATLMKDASCSLGCIQLSVVLFIGSLLFKLSSALWWVDAVTALIIGAFIMQEGVETVKASYEADFSGGCACGGDNMLSKRLRRRFERELRPVSKTADDCCASGACGHKPSSNAKTAGDTCKSGCCAKPVSVQPSSCSKGCCDGDKAGAGSSQHAGFDMLDIAKDDDPSAANGLEEVVVDAAKGNGKAACASGCCGSSKTKGPGPSAASDPVTTPPSSSAASSTGTKDVIDSVGDGDDSSDTEDYACCSDCD